MRLLFTLASVSGLFLALLLVPAAASGSLAVDVRIHIKWAHEVCPPDAPPTTECYSAVGDAAVVRGLGPTQLNLFDFVDRSDPSGCEKWSVSGSLAAGPKGSVSFAASSVGCIASHSGVGKTSFSVTGGSGSLAGTTGSGLLDFESFYEPTFSGQIHLTGTLSAPNYTFDTTPPTLQGVANKTIKVGRNVRRVRVRYSPTAEDAVDGQVAVVCDPRSGSFFKLGRTKVSCSATDSSGNTAQGRFTVTVKRRGR